MTPDLDTIVERPPMTENGTFLSAGLQAMGYDEESANDAIYAIEDEVRDALQTRLAVLEGALRDLLAHHDRQNYVRSRTTNECEPGRIARLLLTRDPDSEERTFCLHGIPDGTSPDHASSDCDPGGSGGV